MRPVTGHLGPAEGLHRVEAPPPRGGLIDRTSRDHVESARVPIERDDAGAHVTDPARVRFWGGYSGYSQDPDGHLWEIAWNPAGEVKE